MGIKGFKDKDGNIQKYDINALDTSFTAEVGQMLIVESVDENGYPNGFSVGESVDNLIKNTDYATSGKPGIIKPAYGLFVSSENLYVAKAGQGDIAKKTNGYNPITPVDLDYAVKVGMTTNALGWTDEEKQSARDLIGASDSGVEITNGDPTKSNTVLTLNPNSEKINLYTAEETDEKLKDLGTVEITSGDPTVDNTVMTLNPDAEDINLYTAEEIDEKVTEINSEINNLKEAGTVEVTGGEPTRESTVMTIDLNSEEVHIYTAEEIDNMFLNFSSEGCGNVVKDKREWQLIRTIIIPEDVSTDTSGVTWKTNGDGTEVRGFSFNVDENGNNFSYDDIMIVGTGGYIASGESSASTNFGSESKFVNCYRMGVPSAATYQNIIYEFNRKSEHIYYPTLKTNTQYAQNWGNNLHGIGNVVVANNKSGIIFDSVYLAQHQGGFKPGTVLKVYGRNVLGNVIFNVPGYTKEEIDAMFAALVNGNEVAY